MTVRSPVLARRMRRHPAWLVLTAILALAACGRSSAVVGPEVVPELEIVTKEGAHGEGTGHYRFEMPENVEAGATRLSVRNEGEEPHHTQLFKLNEDATVDDLAAALATGDPAAAVEYGQFQGGTSLVDPGGTSDADAIVDLTPGTWVVVCFVPGPDGKPHLAEGMFLPFEVTETGEDPRALPTADVEVALVDYAIQVPGTVPGDAVLEITNQAEAEPHEMVIARLDEGVDIDDVRQALSDGTPPPVTNVGGVQTIPPGTSQLVQLDLEPGEYVVVCHVPSPDGTPHHAQGMIAPLVVE